MNSAVFTRIFILSEASTSSLLVWRYCRSLRRYRQSLRRCCQSLQHCRDPWGDWWPCGRRCRSLCDSLNIVNIVKHHETLRYIMKHREPLVKNYEPLVKHHETLVKHHETLVKHHETLVKHHETLIKHHETLVKHHETLLKNIVKHHDTCHSMRRYRRSMRRRQRSIYASTSMRRLRVEFIHCFGE